MTNFEKLMHFEPISRELVSDKVIQQIKERIDTGEFKAGQRLPSEMEMSRMLNVGRSTVREALKVLIYLGILKRRGRHTLVSEGSINEISILRGLARYRDKKSVVDMIEVRRFLEVPVSELASERADEKDIRDLEACVRRMQMNLKDRPAFIKADQEFHFILARATKNKILTRMMESIRMSLEDTVELIVQHRPDIVYKSFRYHEEIFKAIARHQPMKARKAMKDHLLDIEGEFKAILKHI